MDGDTAESPDWDSAAPDFIQEGDDLFDDPGADPTGEPTAPSGPTAPTRESAASRAAGGNGPTVPVAAGTAVDGNGDATPLALYRRYRPDTFAQVIGQEHVTEPLQRALANNRVNHAYLFSGPRGCGKTTSARILARALNCERGPRAEPCGECQSCRDLARGGPGSIDVIEIDAASHGGVDDARDLRERAFFAPVNSRYKIYIIDEAHMVTPQGFNALLKLVEEPPAHVKFVFATTEPDKVIGTIRSRTHHYPFRLVPPKVLTAYLARLCTAEGIAVEQTVLPLVVRAGAGSVRDSLSVLDQLLGGAEEHGVSYRQATGLLGYTPDSLLDEFVDAFAAGDAGGVFSSVDKVIEVGQDPRRFAEDLLRRLRDLVIVAAVPEALTSGLVDVAGDQADRLTSQAASLGAGELTRAAEVIAAGLTDMRGTTAPRLHLELMCARVLLPGADVDERGVHARLDRLERRIGMTDVGGAGAEMPAAGAPRTPPVSAGAEGRSVPGTSGGSSQAGSGSGGTASAPSGRAAEPAADTPPDGDAAAGGSARAQVSSPAAATPVGSRPATGSTGSAPTRPAGRPARPELADWSTPPAEQPPAGSGGTTSPAPGPEATPARPAEGVAPGRPGERTATPSRQPVTPAPAAAVMSVTEIRRLWPQVLDAVKSRRRFTWILLSQNAQVTDVRDGTLLLALANVGARDSFAKGGSEDILREALISAIGVDLRIETMVDAGMPGAGRDRSTGGDRSGGDRSGGDRAGGAGGDQTGDDRGAGGRPAERGPGAPGEQPAGERSSAERPVADRPSDAGWDRRDESSGRTIDQDAGGGSARGTGSGAGSAAGRAGELRRGGHGPSGEAPPVDEPPPDPEDEPPPDPEAGGPVRSASAAAREQARHSIRPTRHGPPDPGTDDRDAAVDLDDSPVDEGTESHTELLARHLGAEIISEEVHSG